jgi:hypothetical protein
MRALLWRRMRAPRLQIDRGLLCCLKEMTVEPVRSLVVDCPGGEYEGLDPLIAVVRLQWCEPSFAARFPTQFYPG